MLSTTTGRRLLAAFAFALLVGVGVADHAGAERVPTGGDSTQRACRSIQDRYNDARSKFNSSTDDKDRARYLNDMRNAANEWDGVGCGGAWGKIYHSRMVVDAPLVVRPIGGIEVVDEPVAPPTVDESVRPIGGIQLGEPALVDEPTDTPLLVPEGEEDGVVTILPVPAPVDTPIIVPEGGDQGVVTIDDPVPAPVEEEQP